jgi:nucleoside-diphosphate-sugar epimerase
VFHLAGLVRANKPGEFETANVTGTNNVARAAVAENVLRFVYVSSLAAAGCSTPRRPKQEADEPKPISDYGKSKLAAESVLRAFADSMQCTVVRPGIVFGEADKMNLELFKAVKKLGICPNPGFTRKIYSWIHAADLADLLILAAKSGERLPIGNPTSENFGQGIYFASCDEGHPLQDIALGVRRALGKKRVIPITCPPMAVWAISGFYEIRKMCTGSAVPFDWAKAYESLHHWTCTSAKAAQQLGFAAQPLDDRIRQTIAWYLDNDWL